MTLLVTKNVHTVEIDQAATAARVRAAREASGLTVLQVATALGYSKQYVLDLEDGRRRWRADLVERVAEVFAKAGRNGRTTGNV